MKLRRKSPTAEAVQWDETETTLRTLKGAGLPWCGNAGHRDLPGTILQLRIRARREGYDAIVTVNKGDWLVREEDGTKQGTWRVFATPDELLAVYEVAP